MKKIVVAIGVILMLSAGSSFAGNNSEGYKLAKSNGCLVCHSINAPKVGPSYKMVAMRNEKLYGENAIKHIVASIENGAKGKYPHFSAVMPPFNYLGKKKIEIIAKWILEQGK